MRKTSSFFTPLINQKKVCCESNTLIIAVNRLLGEGLSE
ncbi:MAG: hypothetical protein HNEKOMLI_00133 [Sodalis sp. Psp]|nr:hypothetical protein [Sodalis sp. Psp]MCR3756631.1 hypothetical protein [Sodalis sp. Ppy]